MHTVGIHIITVMPNLESGNSDTVGWYVDEMEAIKAVKENRGAMEDCLHNYAVIEELPPGIGALPTKETWFKWDDEEHAFKPIPKPEEVSYIICWFG